MSRNSAVLYEKRDQVAYITLNRPEAMNALNLELDRAFTAALFDYRDDPEMLVCIMTGAGGRAFSAGMDLKETAAIQARGDKRPAGALPRFTEIGLWKPIIAAVDGYCLAGGLELALQCDIRIATPQSTFGLPEPRWNMIANYYGCHNLSRMVPLGEALYMQLTGGQITAEEALHCGLVHKVLPDRAALMAEADRIAGEIKLCAPLALQAIKKVVLQCRSMPIEYSYRMGEIYLKQLMESEDGIEGPRAFAEKRRPEWKLR